MKLTLTVLAASAALCFAGAAGAGQPYKEIFHDDGSFVDGDFCGEGLRAEVRYTINGRYQLVPHGPTGLAYFLQHGRQTERITNLANGEFVTTTSIVTEKDKHIWDNGDGTLRILVLATGNATLYNSSGRAIARNPGQVWFEILVNAATGKVIEFLGVVKGSTGRSDDFCEAAVPALS